MAVVGMLLHVGRVCHLWLMGVLRYRRVGFTKAEFDEHVLKIALILLSRMHTTRTIHVVETGLIIVLDGRGVCGRVGSRCGIEVAGSDDGRSAKWHLVMRIIHILGLLGWWWMSCCLLDMGGGEISFAVRLGNWMGIGLSRRVLSGGMWIVLTCAGNKDD